MVDSKLRFQHTITTTALLELTEAEMGALDALAGYGTDPFLKTFYKHMGEAYLKPYETGLRSLFDRIKSTVPSALRDVKTARDSLHKSRANPIGETRA
jgi:hypothetical protein